MQLKNLKTNYLGKTNIFYKKIDSTQTEIWRLIKNNNIQNGTLIMADIQTNGKGTHGRIWHTDEGKNIAFSFFVETNCKPSLLDGITIEIASILIKIFKEKYNIDLKIKEPNDIFYNDKKIGGILTESKVNSEIIKFLVIGIGLNTNQMKFSKDIQNIATSVKKEFNIEINNKEIIEEFCYEFEKTLKRRIDI